MARRVWHPHVRLMDGSLASAALFRDRREAGELLATAIARSLDDMRDLLVLALPRGGVEVAAAVAGTLDAELDVLVVRKIGAPQQPEFAIGAVTTGGVKVIDTGMVRRLSVSEAELAELTDDAAAEVARREKLYRAGRGALRVTDRTVIVVDDGIATGWTMRAAIRLLRTMAPRRIVVAVPVAPEESVEQFEDSADQFICLETPEPYIAVGVWYEDFHPVDDAEVSALLSAAAEKKRRTV